ncbi:unnamed protein product [Schistosoma rodhaini]|nr:unnamed protein product [Schistosoma rodhaini]
MILINDANLPMYTKLQSQILLELIDLHLATCIPSNNTIDEQRNGTPMGSPVSGLISEAIMQILEADGQAKNVNTLCLQHICHHRNGTAGESLHSDQQRLQ